MPIRPIEHGIFASAAGGVGGAAYFGGGSGTNVNKFAFPDDTRTSLAAGLSVSRVDLGGCANSGVAIYFGGGG